MRDRAGYRHLLQTSGILSRHFAAIISWTWKLFTMTDFNEKAYRLLANLLESDLAEDIGSMEGSGRYSYLHHSQFYQDKS